ncbi:phosphoribosylamine--glycine ligase [Alkalilimnicola ehrlichii]|uniref:Phosphoribosylamine--glycine ligase n=1 Tax=Alkalilimnicola ehrlichii TaxID=351052 RepID=A0A3E0X3H9_9GAMM|nr:phosphoribosylamine--glycine ligase [Alkalilimnicola ehrlichii]RFA31455.1 phosphoribosylamine--glycine ligase [Alkalilimnicola ehrlichii]RFA39274.1 phosphoribosylamine--glycine ligase [Alkalilimnicola ehrlichii]
MKVLIIGGGGREHALAWKAAQSARVESVYVAPGNAGTALEPKVHNIQVGAEDIPALVGFASSNGVDLCIVGPEAPLVAGVVDAFQEAGIRCFGPSRAAAELEGSKAFTKEFLSRHEIPTAEYRTFTDLDEARDYIRERGAPIVVKADGLAAGKGVVVARSIDEAIVAAEDMLSGNAFGEAGARVVVEDFLEGEEVSFIVMVDGEHILPLASSQDHKARDNGDQGPNTGGMGAYSPAPALTPALHERVMREIVEPTVRGMAADGRRYTGFLYAGLMIGADGTPRVLEYNCRMGDPETQPIMLRLRTDLIDLCEAAVDGQLHKVSVDWDPRTSVGVVMAAGGYPGSYRKGQVISGLPQGEYEDRKVFHAGTALNEEGQVVSSGGRVLCVCALGTTVSVAQRNAYELVKQIDWDDAFYRTDIGYRAIAREQAE